jgi:hypothetical protein
VTSAGTSVGAPASSPVPDPLAEELIGVAKADPTAALSRAARLAADGFAPLLCVIPC